MLRPLKQARISKAKVLYIHLTGVSQEIVKNLVLAGVHATLCDNRPYPDSVQTTPSFFLLQRSDKKIKYVSVAHAMKAAVEELNPLLGDCEVVDKSVHDLDADFFSNYDMVIASRLGKAEAARVANATTKGGGKFYLVDCFGWDGACVLDLGQNHMYRAEVGKSLSDLKKIESHVPIEKIWNIPLRDLTNCVDKKHPPLVWLQYRSLLEFEAHTGEWPQAAKADKFAETIKAWIATDFPEYEDLECFQTESLKGWASVATAEISPVCAVLGGILGNEVIKAISSKGEPANNCLLFEGKFGKCRNLMLQPKN